MPPEYLYAYEKTRGLIVTEENQRFIPEKDLQEWYAAVREYRERQVGNEG